MADINYRDVELYSYLSSQAYAENGGIPPTGWQFLGDSVSLGIGKDTGYYGAAHQNIDHPEQVVIAHRGTEFANDTVNDVLTADRQIAFGNVPTQYNDAMSFANKISELNDVPVNAIHETGHSLGGNLASLVEISHDAPASVFNAPGQAEMLPQLETMNGVAPGTIRMLITPTI